jgi:hypothetical protein
MTVSASLNHAGRRGRDYGLSIRSSAGLSVVASDVTLTTSAFLSVICGFGTETSDFLELIQIQQRRSDMLARLNFAVESASG